MKNENIFIKYAHHMNLITYEKHSGKNSPYELYETAQCSVLYHAIDYVDSANWPELELNF